jgi:formylglycine-generating enzyme required for sulfatase activity
VCSKEDGVEQDDWESVPNAQGYRLLTEAEWEYACRAGTTTEFSFGPGDKELLPQFAVFNEESPEACGSRLPNGWGLFDMHGNIYEWWQDRAGPDEKNSVLTDPQGAPEGLKRVVRGGSFFNSISVTKTAQRWDFDPKERSQIMGFRVARVLNTR